MGNRSLNCFMFSPETAHSRRFFTMPLQDIWHCAKWEDMNVQENKGSMSQMKLLMALKLERHTVSQPRSSQGGKVWQSPTSTLPISQSLSKATGLFLLELVFNVLVPILFFKHTSDHLKFSFPSLSLHFLLCSPLCLSKPHFILFLVLTGET